MPLLLHKVLVLKRTSEIQPVEFIWKPQFYWEPLASRSACWTKPRSVPRIKCILVRESPWNTVKIVLRGLRSVTSTDTFVSLWLSVTSQVVFISQLWKRRRSSDSLIMVIRHHFAGDQRWKMIGLIATPRLPSARRVRAQGITYNHRTLSFTAQKDGARKEVDA